MSSGRTTSASVDNLVCDFYASGSDAILQDRRGIINPISVGNATFVDNANFCRQALQQWKIDLSKTLILDLYIFDPKIGKHILMERWKFHYQRNTEMKDTKQLGIISRRVLTLLRTLYCFVRMMPGFNLINISAKPPTLSFQLYEQKSTYPTSFVNEISRYSFTPVSTSKGTLTVSVRFITSLAVKDILTNINNVVSTGGHSRRNSRTAEENGSTAAIPIPSNDPHLANPHHDPSLPSANTSGKYSNSLDATDNSYSSHGSGGGSQGTTTGLAAGLAGAVPPGSTPPLGTRFLRNSRERERDAHRRSFQLPPHAEHGGEWYQSDTVTHRNSMEGRDEVEEAVRQLNGQNAQIPPKSAQGGPAHHQQASSLDSYANAQGHMHRLSFDGGNFNHHNNSNNNTSKRTSPSHYLQQQQLQQQRTTNSGSYGGTSTAATSYGNTPPFLLGEMQARQQQLAQQQQQGSSGTGERISGGSYAEMMQQDINNPFPIISGSLTSTSPHTGGNSTMMALIEQHRTTRNGGAGNSNNNNNPGLSLYGTGKTGRLSPNSFSVHGAGELKLNIAPLPSSPFVHLSRGSFSEDGSKAALVAAFTPQRPPPNAGSLGRSLANLSLSLAPPPGDDNTLDTLRFQQQQLQQQNSQYPWYGNPARPYSNSGDVADGPGGGRQLSKESNTSSLDLGGTGTGLEDLEEDMPFAWTEADSNNHPYHHSSGTSASLLMSPAVDSVGAQLLQGLSIHSSSTAAPPHGQYQDNMHNPYDPHRDRAMGRSNMSNSTYTAAGLSGELASKINDFKNLSSTFSTK